MAVRIRLYAPNFCINNNVKKDTLEARYEQIIKRNLLNINESSNHTMLDAALKNPKDYYLHLYVDEVIDPDFNNTGIEKGAVSILNDRGKYDNFTDYIYGLELDEMLDAFERLAPTHIVDHRD